MIQALLLPTTVFMPGGQIEVGILRIGEHAAVGRPTGPCAALA